MKKNFTKGLREIHEKYDTFFIDLWGVIHNGIKLFPDAIEVLSNLNEIKKRYVLISNAPRPSKSVEKYLYNLNMEKKLIKNIFTSGEAALESLKNNIYGKTFFHIGPPRDFDLFKSFEKNKRTIDKSDFILCTGLFEDYEKSLDYYKDLLKKQTNLKMVCTNPDLVVHRGHIKEYCAGSVANVFKDLGGKVVYFGKPYPDIYNFCIKKNERVLAIGDNLNTDILGANNLKLDSLFITEGIHKEEFYNANDDQYETILKKYNVKINYYQTKLKW